MGFGDRWEDAEIYERRREKGEDGDKARKEGDGV